MTKGGRATAGDLEHQDKLDLTMLFTVRVKAHGDAPEEYYAEDIYGVIDQLLDEWVDGDAELPGIFAFLKAEGYDFGISDEEVDEGTDKELLMNAADTVRTVLHINMDDSEIDDAAAALGKLAMFLAAIGDEYQITEGWENDADGESEADESNVEADTDAVYNSEHERAMDEDYDY